MGTNFQKWWADPTNPTEHLGDGISVQNNPPTPDANGIFPPTNYVEYWRGFREQAVKQWVQLVVNWITCNNMDAPGYHLHDCASPFPIGDVFTHQLTDVPDAARDPYYYCSPISTAQVDNAQVGLTVYGPKAANKDKYPGDPPPSILATLKRSEIWLPNKRTGGDSSNGIRCCTRRMSRDMNSITRHWRIYTTVGQASSALMPGPMPAPTTRGVGIQSGTRSWRRPFTISLSPTRLCIPTNTTSPSSSNPFRLGGDHPKHRVLIPHRQPRPLYPHQLRLQHRHRM